MSSEKSLSRQEERVLHLARQGLGDKQIANELGLSTDTVRTYWQRIRQKVGAATRAEIIATLGEKQTAAVLEAVENEKTVLLQEILLRKSTEKALRASELEWRRLADSMPQMVFVAKADGAVFHHNARFHEFTGLNPDAAAGLGYLAAIHPDDVDALRQSIEQSIPTGAPYEAEVRIRRHDGVYLWHMMRVLPYRNERYEVIRWYGTSTDIHESKIVRDQLQLSEARLLQAQEIASLGYYEYSASRHQGLWSPNLFAMFEMPEQTGWFDADDFMNLIDAQDRERVAKANARTFDHGIYFDEVYRVNLPSGRQIFVRSIARPVMRDGKVTRLIGTIQDITEQQRITAEKALSEQKFRALTEASPNGMFVTDLNDCCVYANAQFKSIVGVENDGLLGEGWMSLLHPADRETFLKKWSESRKQSAPFEAEHRYLHKDGSERWVLTRAAVVNLDDDTVGRVGIVQDITARKLADAERERLLSIVELTPDIVGMCDLKLNVTDLNVAARNLFGIAEGKPIPEINIAKTLPQWALKKVEEEGIPSAIANGYWSGETALLDDKGNEVAISQVIIAHKGQGGEIVYFSTVARDISDIKRIQQELSEQRHFIEQVLDANFDIVYIYDLNQRQFRYINRAVANVWGHPVETFLGKGGEEFRKFIHPDDRPTVDPHVQRVRGMADGDVTEVEFRIHTSDGKWRWVNSREAVFKRNEDGSVAQTVGICQDVSYRKPPTD